MEQKDYSNYSLKDLFEELNWAKRDLDEAEKAAKEQRAIYDFLSMVVVPERMEEEGIDNVKVDGIGRINVRADMRVSTKADSRPELYKWLTEHDHSDLITNTINGSTLKAFVKEQIKAGEPIPEEYLNIHAYSRAVITKV